MPSRPVSRRPVSKQPAASSKRIRIDQDDDAPRYAPRGGLPTSHATIEFPAYVPAVTRNHSNTKPQAQLTHETTIAACSMSRCEWEKWYHRF